MNTVSNQQTVKKAGSAWAKTKPNPWIHYAQICLLDEIPGTVFHFGVLPFSPTSSLSEYPAAAKEACLKLSEMWRRLGRAVGTEAPPTQRSISRIESAIESDD
jgi:hypothetical protein